jgi:hypothetical protein
VPTHGPESHVHCSHTLTEHDQQFASVVFIFVERVLCLVEAE